MRFCPSRNPLRNTFSKSSEIYLLLFIVRLYIIINSRNFLAQRLYMRKV